MFDRHWAFWAPLIVNLCVTGSEIRSLFIKYPIVNFNELLSSWNSLAEQFGDNHKLAKKHSKTNRIELGKVASGLWVSPGATRCYLRFKTLILQFVVSGLSSIRQTNLDVEKNCRQKHCYE